MEFFTATFEFLRSQHPVVQCVIIALLTWGWEEPISIGSAIAVATGSLDIRVAFVGLLFGLPSGDVMLYSVGRLGKKFLMRTRWYKGNASLHQAERWFQRRAHGTIFAARFAPGLRLPTYIAAGIFKVRFPLFLSLVVVAGAIETALLLLVARFFGENVLAQLGAHKKIVGACLFGLVVLLQVVNYLRQKARRNRLAAQEESGDEEDDVSPIEFANPFLFYIPVVCHWAWLALRYRGAMLPLNANPSIYASGYVRESKSQILDLFPKDLVGPRVASYVAVPVVPGESKERRGERAVGLALEAGLRYPFVAKPDVGQRGAGVRRVRSPEELREYALAFPAQGAFILQALADFPVECGILYARRPGEPHGRVVSITVKEFPAVTGDGVSTLRELILKHKRGRRTPQTYFARQTPEALASVPAAGETVNLVFCGNHCRGAVFHNGTALITPKLTETFDAIALRVPEFYYGRFDVRCRSIEAIQEGRDFRIVELNGAGAEDTSIWDANASAWSSYKALFRQNRTLFEIGAENRRRGHSNISLARFLADAAAARRLIRQYPPCE